MITLIGLYKEFVNKRMVIYEARSEWTYLITSVYEALLFSFEIITGNIKESLDSLNFQKNCQSALFIIIALVVIPFLGKLTNILCAYIRFIFRKVKLSFNYPDKTMAEVFYLYVYPICTCLKCMQGNITTSLSDSEKSQIKRIVKDLNNELTQYALLKNMIVPDNSATNRKKNRIEKSDFDFCKKILNSFSI